MSVITQIHLFQDTFNLMSRWKKTPVIQDNWM